MKMIFQKECIKTPKVRLMQLKQKSKAIFVISARIKINTNAFNDISIFYASFLFKGIFLPILKAILY